MAATSAEVAESADVEPVLEATAAGQLTSGLAGVIGAPKTSATSEAAEEVLEEPAIGAELTLVASSPRPRLWVQPQRVHCSYRLSSLLPLAMRWCLRRAKTI